ncbi:hypothetical protein AMTR_s00024p00110840 [Amborella trichopoda]|uniref:NADP-dependent oxidoreductase domain-containing protein n=1 Tax=Amborella trichopoda TaxID=13333 RepID=W1PSN8_AMBTC|nr:hypothetical protein AMTR_s00024p00110840 [Amborella trichopoda]
MEKEIGGIPQVVLNSGHKMHLVGLGTAKDPFIEDESLKFPILEAMELGYRHFDTAMIYKSEKALGQAIAEAQERGIIDSRSELFVTSKLWCTDNHPDGVLPALHQTLQRLQLEYLDLYLIHFPARLKGGIKTAEFREEDILPIDLEGTWKAMEECCRLGLTKSIGVSNFSCKKLQDLLAIATIPPAVNQVEMHPFWQQRKLRGFCEAKGIHVEAFSPLGGGGVTWGPNAVLDCELLTEIAQAKGKSLAQVCLRWGFQQGVTLVLKSFKRERLKENLQIFDWELNEEELHKIGEIPQMKFARAEKYVTPEGPFKTLEDIWDGEI